MFYTILNFFISTPRFRKFGLDYAGRIEQSGLQSEKNLFAKSFSPEEVKRFGIEPKEVIYKGIKKVAF